MQHKTESQGLWQSFTNRLQVLFKAALTTQGHAGRLQQKSLAITNYKFDKQVEDKALEASKLIVTITSSMGAIPPGFKTKLENMAARSLLSGRKASLRVIRENI